MKNLSWFRRVRFIATIIALTSGSAIGVSLWRSAAVRINSTTDGKQKFMAGVREGVGKEVRLVRHGDDTKSVRASVESLSQFMSKRSSVDLPGQTKSRLADMETRTLAGASRRITADELSEILAATAIERIAVSTDEEINRAVETMRGFDAPDLPASFRNTRTHARLRASVASNISPENLAFQIRAVRSADFASRALIKIAIKRTVATEVQKRTRYLSEAVPEQFGAVASEGYSPLQAVLIAYASASDDPLAGSTDDLQTRMKSLHDGIERLTGRHYPGSDGRFAYGPNGYIFSSPLDIVLDEVTVNLLLDHFDERRMN
jgi:hypothetical protein